MPFNWQTNPQTGHFHSWKVHKKLEVPSIWTKIMRFISFQRGKWFPSEQSHSEDVFVDTVFSVICGSTPTQRHNLGSWLELVRGVSSQFCAVLLQDLYLIITWGGMIYTHGESALRLRVNYCHYRIASEAYFPDYSSQKVSIHLALLVSL